jgi:plasmid maintenance system killer protein
MHMSMLYQLVRDRQAELAADARSHRARRRLRVLRAAEAEEALAREQWRLLLRELRVR